MSAVAGGVAARAEDSSAVTVTARDQDPDAANAPFPDLAVTVSQTQDLVSQAVTVGWTGGKASTLPNSQNGGENYLQVMQCWGDVEESGVIGPDRTTCQFGGFNSAGARRDSTVPDAGVVAAQDKSYTRVGDGFSITTYTGIPFKAVNGKEVATVKDGKMVEGINLDLNNNEFFTRYTTNEVPWAGSASDGTGSITFELQTALSAPGLGCGAPVNSASSPLEPRSCWLVLVPRGAGENIVSPLFWDQWKHRIAIPLDFQLVGAHCAIGATERQVAGSELVADAMSSWQPALCAGEGSDAYTLLTVTDVDAAKQANTAADAPLAITSQALPTAEGETDGLVYAPIAIAGVSITFAIDRAPLTTASDEAKSRARQPFTSMKLNARLVAKLLTSSYLDALPSDADRGHLEDNPRNLLKDPEFLELNDPEWAEQALVGAVADIMVPQGRSGYARAVWDYVLADADARAFLAGEPDAHGMIVNPWAATDASVNKNGTALELPRDDFPKVDPTEAYAETPKALNSVTWRPYTNDLASGAYYALRGDGLMIDAWEEITPPARWKRADRNVVGSRAVIALTDTSAADRYQTVTAQLQNAAGNYVAADGDSLLAAAAAMTPVDGQGQVRRLDPNSSEARAAASAYPLTIPVYAAANPDAVEKSARASYADMIRYAVTDGQNAGVNPGQLPAGYAPLPQGWRQQALEAANAIEYGRPVPAANTPAAPAAQQPAASNSNPSSAASNGQAAAAPNDPAATGAVAGALSSASTPADPQLDALGAAVPLAIGAGVIAAVLFPIVGRRRRVI